MLSALISVLLAFGVSGAAAKCGLPSRGPIIEPSLGRITNGHEVKPHSIPWQVALVFVNSKDEDWGCGGSLIDRRWVMTAAHCLGSMKGTIGNPSFEQGEQKHDKIHVLLGYHDIQEFKRPNSPSVQADCIKQRIPVDLWFHHPGYGYVVNYLQLQATNDTEQSIDLINDIALLRLQWPATLNECTDVVCLPDALAGVNSEFDQHECYVSGWGSRSGVTGIDPYGPAKLRAVRVEALKCPVFPSAPQSIMCAAGRKGETSCYGDSGGPVFCRKWHGNLATPFVQYGIVSYGRSRENDGCLDGPEWPGFNADVAHFVPWIRHSMQYAGGTDNGKV